MVVLGVNEITPEDWFLTLGNRFDGDTETSVNVKITMQASLTLSWSSVLANPALIRRCKYISDLPPIDIYLRCDLELC